VGLIEKDDIRFDKPAYKTSRPDFGRLNMALYGKACYFKSRNDVGNADRNWISSDIPVRQSCHFNFCKAFSDCQSDT
jgi:hypothetical protein